MRMFVATGIIISSSCYSTFAGKNPMSSGDENEIMPMTSAAPPGSDNDHDASFNNLIDMPTQSKRKKLINCLKVRIM